MKKLLIILVFGILILSPVVSLAEVVYAHEVTVVSDGLIKTITDVIENTAASTEDYENVFQKEFSKTEELINIKKLNEENNIKFELTEEQVKETIEVIEHMHTFITAVASVSDSATEEEWADKKVEGIVSMFEMRLELVPDLDSEIVIDSSITILEALEDSHGSLLIGKSAVIKEKIESIGIAVSHSLGAIDPKKEVSVIDSKTVVIIDPASFVLDIQNTAREFEKVENRVNEYYGEGNVRDLWFEITLETERLTDTVILPIQKEVIKSIKDTPVSRIGLESDGMTLAIHKADLSADQDVELEINFEDSKENANLPADAFIEGYVVDVKYFVEKEEKKVLKRPALISFDLGKFNFGEDVEIDNLSVHRMDEETGQWQPVVGIYDPVTNTLSTNRLQLSQYTIMKSSRSFSDIKNSWAENEINALLNKGILDEEVAFNPEENVTRKEFAVWMTRSYGLVNPDATTQFADISSGDAFAAEIAAGFEAGLFTGRTENSFDPDGSMTREEFSVFVGNALIRYEQKNLNEKLGESLDQFLDSSDVEEWSKDYLALMIELDLLPAEGNNLDPKGIVSKELAASVLDKILG